MTETNPTEESARDEMVASPRFDANEDHLVDEIFGSESAAAAFVRRFTSVNTE